MKSKRAGGGKKRRDPASTQSRAGGPSLEPGIKMWQKDIWSGDATRGETTG